MNTGTPCILLQTWCSLQLCKLFRYVSLINGQSGGSNVITTPRGTDESHILVLLSCVSCIASYSPLGIRLNGMGVAQTETEIL